MHCPLKLVRVCGKNWDDEGLLPHVQVQREMDSSLDNTRSKAELGHAVHAGSRICEEAGQLFSGGAAHTVEVQQRAREWSFAKSR